MAYLINGGKRLKGEIAVYGAKNCALALLGASVLTNDDIVLHNCPDISDVSNMILLLQMMGKTVRRIGDTVTVSGTLTSTCAPKSVATLLRGSALILGSTVAKYHQIALPLPGGCAIGARPMDIHLSGLKTLGVEVLDAGEMVSCKGVPVGAEYKLRFASVGATENLLCACVLAKGESILSNCATEPEVVALEQMLVQMGAKIEGIGSPILKIVGVDRLHGAEFTVIPDRIVAATYLAAAAATLGKIAVTNCCPQHFAAFSELLCSRFSVRIFSDTVCINAIKIPDGYGTITTAPYPLFPTDMQSIMLSLAACSDGKTVICENLFENRLEHNAFQLNKMGAQVMVKDNIANVFGKKLYSASIRAADLRGGAGLVIAALAAEGQSVVDGVEHINRGYVNFAGMLDSIGAEITVV